MSLYYFPNKTVKYYVISRFAVMMQGKSVCPSLLRNAIWNATASYPVNTECQHQSLLKSFKSSMHDHCMCIQVPALWQQSKEKIPHE